MKHMMPAPPTLPPHLDWTRLPAAAGSSNRIRPEKCTEYQDNFANRYRANQEYNAHVGPCLFIWILGLMISFVIVGIAYSVLHTKHVEDSKNFLNPRSASKNIDVTCFKYCENRIYVGCPCTKQTCPCPSANISTLAVASGLSQAELLNFRQGPATGNTCLALCNVGMDSGGGDSILPLVVLVNCDQLITACD